MSLLRNKNAPKKWVISGLPSTVPAILRYILPAKANEITPTFHLIY